MTKNLIRIVSNINTELENRAISLGIDRNEVDIPTIIIESDGDYLLFKFCSIAIFGVESIQDLDDATAEDIENLLRRQVSELCAVIGSLGLTSH